MKLRDELKTRAKLTNNIEDRNVWKKLKNEVNRDVRKEKKVHKENEIKLHIALTTLRRRFPWATGLGVLAEWI